MKRWIVIAALSASSLLFTNGCTPVSGAAVGAAAGAAIGHNVSHHHRVRNSAVGAAAGS
ncbi:YMGG-like glycine zipper-containing protein [Nitratifractor sp.]